MSGRLQFGAITEFQGLKSSQSDRDLRCFFPTAMTHSPLSKPAGEPVSETILEVRDLQVEFSTDTRKIVAVDQVSFNLKRGQTIGIVGESGSGKSVTSLAVMGLLGQTGRVTQGEIRFLDPQLQTSVDLLQLNAEDRRRYRGGEISMVFQEPMSSLNPVFTCGFQLIEAIRQHQTIPLPEARRQAIARLQEVKLLPSDEEMRKRYLEEVAINPAQASESDINLYINQQKLAMLDRFPHQLSGGQLQRVMIAMAIACNPSILIADEPTTALDVTVQATILDLLRELRDARGMSMIFIAHDLGVIAEIADQVAVMYRGKIVEYNNVEEIFANPQHPYTKGLLACRPTLERRLNYLPTIADFMEVEETPTGIKITEKTPDISPEITPHPVEKQPIPDILLEVRNLEVAFPVRGMFGQTERYMRAVNGVSFEVMRGETLGLVGESGCGKTTLARALLRLIEPTAGQILYQGRNILGLSGSNLRQLRREMQIIFQNPYSSLNPRMKIGDAVMEPLQIYGRGNKRQHRDRVAYLLDRVGLNPDWMNRYPHEFSGGQRQRVCIARALALNPQFIICDESVSALDVSVQAQVLNLLKEVQREFGLTYIFISHDLSVVKFMSDRMIVMNRGKIEEMGTAQSIYQNPQQPYTQQLIAAIPTGSLEQIQQRSLARRQVFTGNS